MPFTKFWNLAPNPQDETVLDMYVYGQIKSAASFFGSQDDVVSGEFVRDLNQYENIKTINVHINSPGGSVFAAAAIINQLRKHPACVHTWCDGVCASAAVGILLAANPGCRHMSRATLLMIHNPSTEARGDQKTFIKTADLLGKVKQTLLNIYVEGTGLSAEQLSQMMDDETYLDADEAKGYNFVDDITEETVTYDFRNDGSFACNGISMDVAASLNVSKLKSHLEQLAQGNNTNSKEGGLSKMPETFEAFLSEQEDSVQALINGAITAAVTVREQELTSQNETALQNLQNQVDTLTAELAEARKPQNPDPNASILEGMSEEARALLTQAQADAVEARQKLAAMEEAQALAAFKGTLAVYDKLPLTDEHVKALFTLSKSNPEMLNQLQDLMKVANAAMAAGFGELGSAQGTPVGATAFDRLETAISDYRKQHEQASYNEAMKAVLREDPSLYDAYRDEMGM